MSCIERESCRMSSSESPTSLFRPFAMLSTLMPSHAKPKTIFHHILNSHFHIIIKLDNIQSWKLFALGRIHNHIKPFASAFYCHFFLFVVVSLSSWEVFINHRLKCFMTVYFSWNLRPVSTIGAFRCS